MRAPLPLLLGFFLLTSIAATSLAGPPVVSNVRASQRTGTGLVDIWYDVADPENNPLAITIQVSRDGGLNYNDTGVQSFSGDVGPGIAPGGDKHVVWDAGADWDPIYFPNVRVKVIADDGYATAPIEMRWIPSGNFAMGDNYGLAGGATPAHSLFVSGFYMDQFEVSKALYDEVYIWAISRGYQFSAPGQGQGPDHPIHTISWYDAVKWCNARSEMRGLAPVYFTDSAQTVVYKTGQIDLTVSAVKWSANGYRLPTEAEWEKAARGGLAGHHFPWPSFGVNYADFVSGNRANYANSGDPFSSASVQTTPVGYYNGLTAGTVDTPTATVFTTWPGTFGNGAGTAGEIPGTANRGPRRTTPGVQTRGQTVCGAAARGPITRASCGARIGTTTLRRTPTPTLAFVV